MGGRSGRAARNHVLKDPCIKEAGFNLSMLPSKLWGAMRPTSWNVHLAGRGRRDSPNRQNQGPSRSVAAPWFGWKIMEVFKDWKSVILGVWAAPGAPETFAKGGGLRPPPFARASQAPGATQDPKMIDFQCFTFFINLLQRQTTVTWGLDRRSMGGCKVRTSEVRSG